MSTLMSKITTDHNKFSLVSTFLSALFLIFNFIPVLSFGFLVARGSVSLSFFVANGHPFVLVAFLAGIISLFLSVFKVQRFAFISAFVSFIGVFFTLGGFLLIDSMRDAVAMPVAFTLIIAPLALMINSFFSWKPFLRNRRLTKIAGSMS